MRVDTPNNQAATRMPKIKVIVTALLVAIITLIIYLPALQNYFVNWDDYENVLRNQHIRSFDLPLFKWAFTSFEYGNNWQPLTWISYGIDYFLGGLNPKGFHLQNVLLHSLNVYVLIVLLYRVILISKITTGEKSLHMEYGRESCALLVAALTGMLFGLHPLHVESVAWISERKDVLCGLFFFASIYYYLTYAANVKAERAPLYYGASLATFIFSLCAKPMAVTVPLILLLLDSVCLNRLDLRQDVAFNRRVWIEKVPFLFFSIIDIVFTFHAQQSRGAVKTVVDYPMLERLLNALHSYGFYIWKTIYPVHLSPFYPYPRTVSLLSHETVLSLLVMLCIGASYMVAGRRVRKFWTGAWSYYVITLLPVIGLVQVGDQAAADRYTYLPTIGPLFLMSSGLAMVYKKYVAARPGAHFRTTIFVMVLFVLAMGMSIMTRRQISVWRDTLSLWNRAIYLHPGGSVLPYTRRGVELFLKGKPEEAFQDCDFAVSLNPNYIPALVCRALTEEKKGNYRAAISDYSTVLRLDENNFDVLNNRGGAYMALRDYSHAEEDFRRIVQLDTSFFHAPYNLACLHSLQKHRPEEACYWLELAVKRGFRDIRHLETDSDLDAIRRTSCYRDIVHKIQEIQEDNAGTLRNRP